MPQKQAHLLRFELKLWCHAFAQYEEGVDGHAHQHAVLQGPKQTAQSGGHKRHQVALCVGRKE